MKKIFKTKGEALDFFDKKLWSDISNTMQISQPIYNEKKDEWEVEWSYYKIKNND